MKTTPEKRREERFMMEVPVNLDSGMGVSRDISQSGIYFITDQHFQPGGDVRFSVKLDYARSGKPVRLDCQAQVLRVEPNDGSFGVAARINNFWCVH